MSTDVSSPAQAPLYLLLPSHDEVEGGVPENPG